jgi:hypothetical protein
MNQSSDCCCISVCIRAPLTCKFNKLKCDITCGDQLPEEGEVSTIWNHCCAYSNSNNSANYSLAELEYLTYLNVGENFPSYKLTKDIQLDIHFTPINQRRW